MIAVRPAQESDAPAAIDVVRRSITQLCVADHRNDESTLATWLTNKTSRDFLVWLANTDNFCVVAESENRLSGVGVVNRKGEILLFYISPEAQRQGIGKMIHAALEEKANQSGLASLHLDSTALACPFYEAMGYRPTGPAAPRFGVMQTFPYAKELQSHRYTGGCVCGAVRIEITAAPLRVGICHCLDCRKRQGAIFHTFAVFPARAVTVAGETREYMTRSFCPTCGSPLFDRFGDEFELHVGCLDAPNQFKPSYEGWIIRREAWLPPFDVANLYEGDRHGWAKDL